MKLETSFLFCEPNGSYRSSLPSCIHTPSDPRLVFATNYRTTLCTKLLSTLVSSAGRRFLTARHGLRPWQTADRNASQKPTDRNQSHQLRQLDEQCIWTSYHRCVWSSWLLMGKSSTEEISHEHLPSTATFWVTYFDNSYASGPHGHAPNAPPGRGKFLENGREYQLWHRGQYLFPIDEVRIRYLPASC